MISNAMNKICLLLVPILFWGTQVQSIAVLDYLIPDTSNITRRLHVSRYGLFDDKWFDRKLLYPFQLLERKFDRLYMSANGEVVFGSPPADIKAQFSNCTPGALPRIMVFNADANNEIDRSSARFYFSVDHKNTTLLRMTAHEISLAFPGHKGIVLQSIHVMLWKNMPFFGATEECDGTNKRNTFQLILASNEKYSFALMSFNKTEWSAARNNVSQGDCEGRGGIGAKVGVDTGDGENWFLAPHSCTDGIMNVVNSSNLAGGRKGSWIFQLSPALRTGSCQEFKNFKGNRLTLNPRRVNWMGRVPLELEGPCIHDNYTEVACLYEGMGEGEMKGIVLQRQDTDLRSVVCPMPSFSKIGRVVVHLKIYYDEEQNETYKGNLYVMDDEDLKPKNELSLEIITSDILDFEMRDVKDIDWDKVKGHDLKVNLTWNKETFDNKNVDERILPQLNKLATIPTSVPPRDDLQLVLEKFDFEKNTWTDVGVIKDSIPNSGSFTGSIDRKWLDEYAEILREQELKRQFERDFHQSQSLEVPKVHQPEPINPFNAYLKKAGDAAWNLGRATSNILNPALAIAPFLPYVGAYSAAACAAWSAYDKYFNPPVTGAEPCPPTQAMAMADAKFGRWDGWYSPLVRPGIGTSSYRQKVSSGSGASANCVYDKRGNIITGPNAGMGVHRYSPTDHKWKHLFNDVLPYMACCRLAGGGFNKLNVWSMLKPVAKLFDSCRKYKERRPGDDGSKYPRPRVTRAVGDPHITTFDGFQYTFNGVGEFLMVRMFDPYQNASFEMQARCEQYIKSDGKPTAASVFTAVAMKQQYQGEEIRIQVNYVNLRFSVELNGEMLDDFEDQSSNVTKATVTQKGFSLTMSGESVDIVFSSGFTFHFTSSDGGAENDALNILGTAEERIEGLTKGLMGNCDGDPSNDLVTPDGQTLSNDTASRDIHYLFGLAWMIKKNESIFSYWEGKSYENYSNPGFVPKFIDMQALEKLPERVKKDCAGQGQMECLFDYETTGNKAIAGATKTAVVEFEEKAEILKEEVRLCSEASLPQIKDERVDINISNFVPGDGTAVFRCLNKDNEQENYFVCLCDLEAEWDCGERESQIERIRCDDDAIATTTITSTASNTFSSTPITTSTLSPFPKYLITTTAISATLSASPTPASNLENCQEPILPAGGYMKVSVNNFSVGSTFQYSCHTNYESMWSCQNETDIGRIDSICYKLCNVNYICVKQRIIMRDGSKVDLLTWRGTGTEVRFLDCKGALNKWVWGEIWGQFLSSGKFIVKKKETGTGRIVSC